MSCAEGNYEPQPVEYPMGDQSMVEVSTDESEVAQTIQELLGDNPREFLAQREAQYLQDIQAETQRRRSEIEAQQRKHGVLSRLVAFLLEGSRDVPRQA